MARILVLLAVFLFLMWNLARTIRRLRLSPFGRQLAALWRISQTSTASGDGTHAPAPGPTASVLRRCSRCDSHVPEARLATSADGDVVCRGCLQESSQ